MFAGNNGVVAMLKKPNLKYLDQPSLIKFETEYAAYKAAVDGVHKDRTEEDMITTSSIKDSFHALSLHTTWVKSEI